MQRYVRFFEKDYETIEKDLKDLEADINEKKKIDAEKSAKDLKLSLKAQDAKVDGNTAHYKAEIK